MLYRGEFIEPGKGFKICFVDDVVGSDQVEDLALAKAAEFEGLPSLHWRL